MSVLNTQDSNGQPVTTEQYQKDYPLLVIEYNKARKEILLFDMFGGVLTVNGNRYQVA